MLQKKAQDIVFALLAGKTFRSDDELYQFLVLSAATAFAFLIHIALTIFHLFSGIQPLIIASVASFAIYLACFHLLRRKLFAPAGLILAVEVCLYTLFSIVLIGSDNYIIFYLLIIAIMQVHIPYTKAAVRGFVVLFCWLCVLVSLYMDSHMEPLYDIGSLRPALSALNIHVGLIGTIAELSIGGFLRRVINLYNEARVEELKNQAHTDPLTGLFNRRYADIFFTGLRSAKPDRSWCVAILDIDDFKRINDTYGHSVGDAILVELADIMKSTLRRADKIIRWGGEEFLMLLENVEPDTARGILDKMRQTIADKVFVVQELRLHLTVTIGVCALVSDRIGESIVSCDKKMYLGKVSGKNQVVI